ncbi:MAG: hypothetical protein K0S74_1697 [Chlamydiales bacterium]|jgi:DNA-binding CsgD family transcriptional regulator|nr:hypothetical protein [Chlamydiales bacterium]
MAITLFKTAVASLSLKIKSRKMKNIYDQIGPPSVKHHRTILKLLEPLRLLCGIDRFWRNSHSNDRSYSLIGNYPPTAEAFFGQHLYLGHPYFRKPTFFQTGYVIPEILKCEDYERTQGKLREKGDCYHVLIHIRKDKNGFVEYGFATSNQYPGFEMVYLNHLEMINKFIDYFEEEASKITLEAHEYSINISQIIGSQYNEKPDICSNILVPQKQLNFLAAIQNTDQIASLLITLTNSEKACLKQYLTGKTTKEIAGIMYRSPRTIESHLEKAKAKLYVNSRSALFELLMPYCDLL